MSLSPPATRRKLHHRHIAVEGFERDDGLFDIEAEIVDTKTHDIATLERFVRTGEAMHHMRLRLTIDLDYTIHAAEAVTLAGPLSVCPGGAATFALLKGLTIKSGFMRAANERMGGVLGCTHIRELLQQMATVAFQSTIPAIRVRREAQGELPGGRPAIAAIDSCFALDSRGDFVRNRFPERYTGDKDIPETSRH